MCMCIHILLFSHSVLSDSLGSHGLQHAKHLCPSLSPWVCLHPCSLSQWCHPTISSSVVPFSSCPQSSQHQLFASGSQSIEVSASVSVLPVNIQGWFPLGLTGLISLLSKGLSRGFSCSTICKTLTSIHDRWKNHYMYFWKNHSFD